MDTHGRTERAERARGIVETLTDRGVAAVALTFVDNAGISRVKTVPVSHLPEAASWGVGMSPVFDFFLVDDSIAPEGSPVGDLRLLPDLDRLTALAAQPGWAWSPVDRHSQAGEPHPGCQRHFARRMAETSREQGLEAQMGFEIEWIVGSEDAEGNFAPACHGPAYGMGRLVELASYVAQLHRSLAEEGVRVLQIHPEYAAGQFEVSVAPSDPVAAADTAVLVRETIRALTYAQGMRPSFAPVVTAGGVGNGGHVHVSVWREGRNQLSSGNGRHGLSGEGEAFLAGVLAELPALAAIGAPSPASYIRLVPSHWAGAYRCWGLENREAALRLITGSAGEHDRAANAEIKCFDQAANPYLVVGAVLAAGLAGVKVGGRLPEEVTVDPALLADGELARRGVERLPRRLEDALNRLATSEVLAEAMGGPLLDAFLAVRRGELALFAEASDDEVVARTRWRY